VLPTPPQNTTPAQPAFSSTSVPTLQAPGEGPFALTVIKPEARVKCGGGTNHYDTLVLHKDDKVVVLRKSAKYPGHYEIKPPNGSFSWINDKSIQRYGKVIGVVNDDAGEVKTRIGSSERGDEPKCENDQPLSRGQLVIILNPGVTVGGNTWLPIAPTPGEVRYIAEADLSGTPERLPEPNSQGSARDLMARAEKARQEQQWAAAYELYKEAARRSHDDHEKLYCASQMDKLAGLVGAGGNTPIRPVSQQYQTASAPTGPFQFATQKRESYTNQPNAAAATAPNSAPPAAGVSGAITYSEPKWTQWGVLARTSFKYDGKATYRLNDKQGRLLTYAVTLPQYTLEPYVGQMVCLGGPSFYPSDGVLHNHCIVANRVVLPNQVQH
jgi:hypothetical protein